MTFHIVIPTKNNPMGLCALLGSIRAQKDSASVVIADASDIPVIQHNQVARLLVGTKLRYEHRPDWADVNSQRIHALSAIYHRDYALLLDDDLILKQGHLEQVERLSNGDHLEAVFGVTVDQSNEKGYEDYEPFSSDVEDNFSFNTVYPTDPVESSKLQDYSATIGHMLGHAGLIKETLIRAMHLSDNPAVADDAAALAIARRTGGMLSRPMRAWHAGNGNANWRYGAALKHPLVSALVQKILEG